MDKARAANRVLFLQKFIDKNASKRKNNLKDGFFIIANNRLCIMDEAARELAKLTHFHDGCIKS